MSKPPANRLDAVRLAAEGVRLERRFSLAGFPRLAESLVASQGDATATFAFLAVAEGIVGCEYAVEATLALQCQRCLEAVDFQVRSRGRLAFLACEAETSRVPEGAEAVTVDPRAVDLHALVEDELLLSLPLVPRHEDSACGAPEDADAPASAQPFAALRDLLQH